MISFDPDVVLRHFYPQDTPLRRLLIRHSTQVRDMALRIMDSPSCRVAPDREVVSAGAMLHDVGVFKCHAPSILCTGELPYVTHGVTGAALLREYGRANGLDMEPFARICERHTGSGITAEEVVSQGIPIPVRDYLPETLEEKLICLADKFFSKSGDMKEKSVDAVRGSLARFGSGTTERFDALLKLFGLV